MGNVAVGAFRENSMTQLLSLGQILLAAHSEISPCQSCAHLWFVWYQTASLLEEKARLVVAALGYGDPALPVQCFGGLVRSDCVLVKEFKPMLSAFLVTFIPIDKGQVGGQVHAMWSLLDCGEEERFGFCQTVHRSERGGHARDSLRIRTVTSKDLLVFSKSFRKSMLGIE